MVQKIWLLNENTAFSSLNNRCSVSPTVTNGEFLLCYSSQRDEHTPLRTFVLHFCLGWMLLCMDRVTPAFQPMYDKKSYKHAPYDEHCNISTRELSLENACFENRFKKWLKVDLIMCHFELIARQALKYMIKCLFWGSSFTLKRFLLQDYFRA